MYAKIRIQKLLAHLGYGSRRQIEKLITESKIKINNKYAKLGDLVDYKDSIKVCDKKVDLSRVNKSTTRIIIYNKPPGEICSRNDPQNRPTVYDNLPSIDYGRWVGIGRLDYNTSGVYLFTNDGDFANYLIQPKSKITRKYLVKINRVLKEKEINAVKQGVIYQGNRYKVDYIRLSRTLAKSAWYIVEVSRGRNHEIKNIFKSQGVFVGRLIRTSYGGLTMPRNLKKGEYCELSLDAAKQFKQSHQN